MDLASLISSLGDTPAWLVVVAFFAVLVEVLYNRWAERRRQREAERDRLRAEFSKAFATYTRYMEFPFRIRRRRADLPADERQRLSNELSNVQEQLRYYEAWTVLEDPEVGHAYGGLLAGARDKAGRAMREAWGTPGVASDDAMNATEMPDFDPKSNKVLERVYLSAVKQFLSHKRRRWFPRMKKPSPPLEE